MANNTYHLFVYGSLKRGYFNHPRMAGQTFLADAVTEPTFALHDLGDYPGMIRANGSGCAVSGELWAVDADALERLDRFESDCDPFRREEIAVVTDDGRRQTVWTYIFYGDVTGRPNLGATWGK